MDENNQNNIKIEDFEDFWKFINYGHNWVINNLINPKFQEKIKGKIILDKLGTLVTCIVFCKSNKISKFLIKFKA